jgi:hypothetical protein
MPVCSTYTNWHGGIALDIPLSPSSLNLGLFQITAVWAIVDLCMYLAFVRSLVSAHALSAVLIVPHIPDRPHVSPTMMLPPQLLGSAYIARTRHLIFNFPLSKLYTNSLMSSLNARQTWSSSQTNSHSHSDPGLSSFPPRRQGIVWKAASQPVWTFQEHRPFLLMLHTL